MGAEKTVKNVGAGAGLGFKAGGPPGAAIGAGIGLLGSGLQAFGAGKAAAQAREDEERRRKLEQENFEKQLAQQSRLQGRSQDLQGIDMLSKMRSNAMGQFGQRQFRDGLLAAVRGV